MDLVKGLPSRIYPVGRLDADSAGLLILSNDGAFTQTLTHPSHQVPKTYRVVARGEVPDWAGADLRKGIMLDDGMTAPAEVEWVDFDEGNNASIIDVTIHEGRNRQIRRMFDAIGYPVLALTRTRIGPVVLKGLAPGTWRKLHPTEVQALLGAADVGPAALPQTPVDHPEEFDRRRDEAPERPAGEYDRGPARPPRRNGPPKPPRTEKPNMRGGTPPTRPKEAPMQPQQPPAPVRANVTRNPREEAAREAAHRLAAQLNATPDEDDEKPKVRRPHGAPAGGKGPRNKP
jgi:pseudouridine synthase